MIDILIIEDHGVVREGLHQMLTKTAGYQRVETAASGREGLQVLSGGFRPDILLTDLHLGDMSGVELIRKVKTLYPDIKIAMLTMETDERFLTDAFGAGANGYILKEADQDELLFGLRKVYEGRRFICTGLIDRLSEHWMRGYQALKPKGLPIELSSREAEILELISNGYTNIEIADKLFTSRRTVEGHRLSLLQKTGVRNTPELIKFAMLHGMLQAAITD